jgi:hypothetical protein
MSRLLRVGVSLAAVALSAVAVLHASGDDPAIGAVPVAPEPSATPETRADFDWDEFECRVPEVPIDVRPECAEDSSYPDCRWRIADAGDASHLYGIWHNTKEWNRSARPALVALVLAAAHDYARLYPGEKLVIGDLDAPGPRHQTHDRGRDVDLYLPGSMIAENRGGGLYPSNYLYRGSLERRMLRGRVESLAKILATCTDGRVRIYYNDPPVNDRIRRWFSDRGFESPFGKPIRNHNDLHRFHFHVTVPEDLPLLGGDPIFRVEDDEDLWRADEDERD